MRLCVRLTLIWDLSNSTRGNACVIPSRCDPHLCLIELQWQDFMSCQTPHQTMNRVMARVAKFDLIGRDIRSACFDWLNMMPDKAQWHRSVRINRHYDTKGRLWHGNQKCFPFGIPHYASLVNHGYFLEVVICKPNGKRFAQISWRWEMLAQKPMSRSSQCQIRTIRGKGGGAGTGVGVGT